MLLCAKKKAIFSLAKNLVFPPTDCITDVIDSRPDNIGICMEFFRRITLNEITDQHIYCHGSGDMIPTHFSLPKCKRQ